MNSKVPKGTAIAERAVHELREYARVSVYLYVCFGALILYKTAILHGQGVSYEPWGIAIVKALILGKFVLLGQAAGLGDRYESRRLIYVIAHKALLFLILLLVLTVIEEIVVGLIHGRAVAASLSLFLGDMLLQTLATCAVMLLILIPYLAFRELEEVLGAARLREILFEPRAGLRAASRRQLPQAGPVPSGEPASLGEPRIG